MTAWDELQAWLKLNVGSKEAEQCLALVSRVVAESHSSRRATIVAAILEHKSQNWGEYRGSDRELYRHIGEEV